MTSAASESIRGLLVDFVEGKDRTLDAAGRLEVAIDQAFPDDNVGQALVLALASYRPGGGDYLHDEASIVSLCQQFLRNLSS